MEYNGFIGVFMNVHGLNRPSRRCSVESIQGETRSGKLGDIIEARY